MPAISTPNICLKYILKAILFCIVFTLLLVLFSFTKSLISSKFDRLSYGVIGTAVAFFTTYIFLRWDKKSFSEIGLRFEKATIKKFLVGVLIGVVLMGFVTMCVIYFSDFSISLNGNSNLFKFLLYTSPLILLSLMEEVGFRAYPLMILKNKLDFRMAIIIISILFAVYHIANGWSVTSSFFGPGICGIIFGASAIYAKGIAMPTGIHYAFNLTTAAFGITNDSFNIWVLKQKNGLSLENYQNPPLVTILPQLFFLIVGLFCLRFIFKQKNRLI